MGFNDILRKIFGNKAQRDLKEIEPYVIKTQKAYETVIKLSNDELRDLSNNLKQRIQDYIADEVNRIQELKNSIETTEINLREKIYTEIDKLEKDIIVKNEKILEEILPEAFAVVKDTARRFSENQGITVSATQFDRELAVKYDFVTIQGDKAIYKNEWLAGGNMIKWDMVHYDVQLFGGTVLHKGKIAEMATG
ncbi:MAG: preprotein translocase subunit SecA, partial [Paludibacter sp.]|nr:preprotein translocase subunit SecA [Paludibacter sp.]